MLMLSPSLQYVLSAICRNTTRDWCREDTTPISAATAKRCAAVESTGAYVGSSCAGGGAAKLCSISERDDDKAKTMNTVLGRW